ncbi:putative peptide zinc metalloprotease protein [Pseudarthrobacter sp. PvP090]
MSSPHGGPSSTDGPPVFPAPDSPAPSTTAVPVSAPAAPAAATGTLQVPVRADGVQLLGETQGSGYREAPSLVRRADGQTLQLTRLLYLVLEAVDGTRGPEEIASHASAGFGRQVSADNVRTLIDSQLLPLGLLQLADGSQPEVRKADPLLGMKFRYTVTDPERTRRITAPFATLFHPLIVVLVTAAFLAACWWVFMVKGLASATHEAFANPGLVLLILAVTVLSAGFHEFGHAAAARRGGATPGAMGTGLYLIWPAFFTDVTDSYRLGRAGRIRTDLGGLYFNAIVAVAIMGIWWATGFDALLLVVVTQVLQMVRQLLPLVRFDGYHILADATGVPDLFQRIKPTLLSLLPWRRKDPEAQVLKPWARAVVTAWVLITVPLLLFSLVLMVLSLPRLLGTAWDSVQKQYAMFNSHLADGDLVDAAVRVLAIAAVALPVLGIFYILFRMARQLATALWQKTRGKALQRGTALAAVAAVVAGLAWAWWPGGESYRPVQPYERGTLADATTTIFPAGSTTGMREGRAGRTVALWPAGAEKPTREDPQLSMVLVPRDAGTSGTTAPAWVFPFDQPAAPEQDGNQSLAVNTTDGSVAYDVAFALVWADDGEDVTTRNEAYAFASCADCSAVAVGFQVVLIVGQTDVIVPENLSAAANDTCVRCLTYALASQLVLTLDGPLSADGTSRLNELWQQISDYGRTLADVPLSEIQGRLDAFKVQIMEVIKSDPTATPRVPSGTAPATPGSSPSPSATPSGIPGATTGATPGATSGATSGVTPGATRGATPAATVTAPAATSTATAPARPQPTESAAAATAPAAVAPSPSPTATAPPVP